MGEARVCINYCSGLSHPASARALCNTARGRLLFLRTRHAYHATPLCTRTRGDVSRFHILYFIFYLSKVLNNEAGSINEIQTDFMKKLTRTYRFHKTVFIFNYIFRVDVLVFIMMCVSARRYRRITPMCTNLQVLSERKFDL